MPDTLTMPDQDTEPSINMDTNFDDFNWAPLIDDIRDELCVLFIGPDIIQINGEPLSEVIRGYIKKSCDKDQIIQDYARDAFFLFKDGRAKTNARRCLSRFYRSHTIDETLFKKILDIPFHLVVSMNADTILDDVAYKYGLRHRFDFFRSRNRPVGELEKPTKATPLFYNLCGCKNQDDSLLLDYEDLFQLLQSALGSPGLPQKLKEALNDARTFLFMGFQFDKWYTQLLMRLLQGEGADKTSKVIGSPVAAEDTQVFLVRQFNIEFLGNEYDFFDILYKECKQENLLRQLSTALGDDATSVMRFVQNNQLNEALEALRKVTEQNADLSPGVILLMNRYRNYQEENEKGKLDSRDAHVELNRIVDAILDMTKQCFKS